MKAIEQLSKATLKRRLQAIYALSQATLSQMQLDERTQIEHRLYEIARQAHPPVRTPRGFIEKSDEEW